MIALIKVTPAKQRGCRAKSKLLPNIAVGIYNFCVSCGVKKFFVYYHIGY